MPERWFVVALPLGAGGVASTLEKPRRVRSHARTMWNRGAGLNSGCGGGY